MQERKLLWNAFVTIKKRIDWKPFLIPMKDIKNYIKLSETEVESGDFLIFNGKDFVPFTVSIENAEWKSFIAISGKEKVPLFVESESSLYIDGEYQSVKNLKIGDLLKHKKYEKGIKVVKIKEDSMEAFNLTNEEVKKIFKIKVDAYLEVNWFII